MNKRIIGLDIETYDPLLKTAGYSWKYRQGYVLATALYYEDKDKVAVIAGIHNDNCPYDAQTREEDNRMCIEMLLRNPDVIIVGANIIYDLGWLLYEYKMTTYDVKCTIVDVLQAEHLLNEFKEHTLDSVSKAYLKYGKTKDRIKDWVRENVSKKGDFRQYLKDAPWELLVEYVSGDAKNPVKVWHKQRTLLVQQELLKRVKMEFDCILPTLEMTRTGIPFDNEQRKKNLAELIEFRDLFRAEFNEKYNVPKFKVTSSKQVASLLDRYSIPYRYKFTLKGYGGLFKNEDETDSGYAKAKKIVSSFRLEKGVPVAYIPCEMAERTADLLKEEGFMFNWSPSIDKKFYASQRDNYELVDLLANWKQAEGIISKILGDKYERFICPDGKIRPQFKITDTKSFRYSSNAPNFQQIPSKNGLKVGDKEFSFPAKIRTLCYAPTGCVFGKIDYGQIEYRLICNIACGESGEEVRRQYAENPKMDFHQYVVDLTGLSRKYAKNMSFGVSFGMGLASMAETFGWTMEKAEEISEKYHEHMPFVAPTLALVGDIAIDKGYIKTVYGSHARLASPKKKYTMLNRYTQGSGAECLKASIIQAYKEGVWRRLKVANTVHDELNMPYVPATEQGVIDIFRMAEIMRTSIPLRVPLEATPEIGTDWYHVKEVAEWIECKKEDNEDWKNTSQEVRDFVTISEKLLAEGKIVL